MISGILMKYIPKTDNLNPDYTWENYVWYDLGFWGLSFLKFTDNLYVDFGCSGVSNFKVYTEWKYDSLLNLTDKGKWLVKW